MRSILLVLLAGILFACSIETNHQNGLNESTFAENSYGSRVDIHSFPKQKKMMQQQAESRGLVSSRETHTDIVANPTNGLNE